MNDVANNDAGEKMLAMLRAKFPQYHPLMAIAEMAHDATIDDHRLKLECHKTLVRYVAPELKSVQVVGKLEVNHRRVIVSMFDGEGETHENPPQVAFRGADPLCEQLAMIEIEEELVAA